MQLDLFLDSRAVTLANETISAIADRDHERATRVAAELRIEAEDYPTLPALETLARALAEWQRPPRDASRILSAVAMLEEIVAPAARAALAARANDAIGPFFRELAEASHGLAYEPSRPRVHRAWLSLRCGDWEEAEEAALGIPDASGIPDALQWVAVARYHRVGLSAARPALFALAWRAPSRLAALLDELEDEVLDRDFRRFNAASEWSTIGASELPAWFPAWYVLEHPAGAVDLNFDVAAKTPPVRAARLVDRILERERQGDWKTLVALREQLRGLSVELFSLYMARREVNHAR